jgi:uridine phosphorylase
LAAYLRPTAPIAAAAVLPDDPALALALARAILEGPMMSNHSYGLWGYYGRDGDGRELTVQATGIGAGGAAAVLGELADLGVRRAVRVGRCSALAPDLAAGDRVRAIAGLPTDGVSRALAARSPLPDPDLDRALAAAAPGAKPATVAGCDLDPAVAGPEARSDWIAAGAAVADMQTAALLALGERLGVALAAGLVVAGPQSRAELDEDALTASLLELGGHAARALAALPSAAPAAGSP